MEIISHILDSITSGSLFITEEIFWIFFIIYCLFVLFVSGALFYHWATYRIPGVTHTITLGIIYVIGVIFFLTLSFSFLLNIL